jgi:hypothetical protein
VLTRLKLTRLQSRIAEAQAKVEVNLESITSWFLRQLSHSLTEKEAKFWIWKTWQNGDQYCMQLKVPRGGKMFCISRSVSEDGVRSHPTNLVFHQVRVMVDDIRRQMSRKHAST